jgi:hypothetical protein
MAADGAPGHMWIHLHRLVEGLCQTTGRGFEEVFAQLEQSFGFSRGDRRRWPESALMFQVAALLHAEREAFLAERRAWIARQRAAKARSRRGPAPAELREAEARVREHAARVRETAARFSGKWGWESRGELLRRERG